MGVFMLLITVFALDMRWKLRDLQRSRREESMVGPVFLWYIQNRQLITRGSICPHSSLPF